MKKVLLTVALLLAVAGSYAQPVEPMLSKGTRDIALYGFIDFEGTGDDVDVDLEASYGYFFWDQIEIGGEIDWASGEGYDILGIGAFGEYNFKPLMIRVVPYLGLSLGYGMVDITDSTDENAFVAKVYGGIKYFITDITAIDLSMRAKFAAEDLFINDREPDNID